MSVPTAGRILLIEDDPSVREELSASLAEAGHDVSAAGSVEEGRDVLTAGAFDLIVTDLRLPGASGMEMLELAKSHFPHCQVLVVTAHASVESAVEAMRRGAFHYLVKPFRVEALLVEIDKALEHAAVLAEREGLRANLSKERGVSRILGKSRAIESLRRMVLDVAQVDSTVLISGETGTGKELVADALHFEGPRAGGPLVKVNCAAISESLLESEVFGHEKGAFTGADRQRRGRFERAHGGTLFLDEISEMGAGLQAKLLRVLQGEPFERIGGEEAVDVDARLIAATNLDPEKAVEQGQLREDLFYRLNIVRIEVPPLHDRCEDVPVLSESFIERYASRFGKRIVGVADEALGALMGHDWPGNVRELENCVERAVVLAQGDTIEISHLSPTVPAFASHAAAGAATDTLDLKEMEWRTIIRALEATGGNKAEASRQLGIFPSSLYKKMKRLGISLKRPC